MLYDPRVLGVIGVLFLVLMYQKSQS